MPKFRVEFRGRIDAWAELEVEAKGVEEARLKASEILDTEAHMWEIYAGDPYQYECEAVIQLEEEEE